MTAREIRQAFLQFFQERGHQLVPSSSLVPADDPTLLFTNAGMNQFKDVLLGREQRSYRRAVSVQKCVRAGGKHNDLEMVGRTARHHTFFEMLGNWSFGDYFKEDAIRFAWTFVTEVLHLPAERLWVTVYRDDDEAFSLWQEIAGMPAARIVRLGEKENFWEMADTGPCGPCTELYMDRGSEFACGPNCGIGTCDCDRFEEFWNLVFIQYDRQADGRLVPLPAPSVDTGMGLERITAIMENVPSNYDTELLRPLIAEVEALSGRRYDPGPAGMPFRVIADHSRAVTMLLADGVVFANDGRGYVMRRILRRAVRYGRELGLHEPFLWRLVPIVGGILGEVYPEVRQGQDTIMATIRAEEDRFFQTLETGLRLLDAYLTAIPPGGRLAGEQAFVLADTYGFPLDITEDVARERGVAVDRAGFERALEEQRERARRVDGPDDRVPAMPPTRFRGYDTLALETVIAHLVQDGVSVPEAAPGQEVLVYLPETPFYPEGGGQVGDTGWLEGPAARLRVVDCQRRNGAIWHRAVVERGPVRVGDPVTAVVSEAHRLGAMRNHTGTHLLHAALRSVLGSGARQTGSLVAPDRLRFDFTHPEPLSPTQLRAVEDLVNQWILEDRPVVTVEMELAQARESGAIAFFGEKYGERVRVVEVPGASKELCGGTHCSRTGQIGCLRITEETGIGSGIRRIEAVTGWGALAFHRATEERLEQAAVYLKSRPSEVPERVAELVERLRTLERWQAAQAEREAEREARRLLGALDQINGLKAVVAEAQVDNPDQLRRVSDFLGNQVDVMVLGARGAERAWLLARVGPEGLRRGMNAGSLVRAIAPAVGGGGGGRPDLAQAGGKRPEGMAEALAAAKTLLENERRQDIARSGAK